jgi:hypothetical protein
MDQSRRNRLPRVRPRRFRGRLVAALVVGVLAIAAAPTLGPAHPARWVHAAATPRILFGLGPEADGARKGALAASAPLGMLTSWYNGPEDLAWMTGWKSSEIAHDYASGYAMQLVVWSGAPHTKIATRFGTACGEAYPISAQFLADMRTLAKTWAPPAGHKLYVTLFAEFQTYACKGNEWSAEAATTAYLRALKEQYRASLAIFHRLAPGSEVALGWGGWQTRWNSPGNGGGLSLFKHFADVMKLSDYESFQVMNSSSATSDIAGMTHALAPYGPVMLAYFRPSEDGTQASVLQSVLSRSFLERLVQERLFSLAFMDERFMPSESPSFITVREAVKQYGCTGCGP